MLDCHMKYEHSGEEPVANNLSERDDFRQAMPPKTMEEEVDDRQHQLCVGRFLPGPVNCKEPYRSMPLVQTPVLTKINLDYIGISSVNRSTMMKCHDRSSDKIKLQLFAETNLKRHKDLRQYNLTGGSMIEGKGYVEIKSINDAMIALHNYENIWRYRHPLCYGLQVLFRAMFEQHIQGKVPTAAIMIRLLQQHH